jgi:hypothetical protein
MKDHPSQWIHSRLTCRDVTDRASEYLDDRLPVLTNVRVGCISPPVRIAALT